MVTHHFNLGSNFAVTIHVFKYSYLLGSGYFASDVILPFHVCLNGHIYYISGTEAVVWWILHLPRISTIMGWNWKAGKFSCCVFGQGT